jgi:hypothetical protein
MPTSGVLYCDHRANRDGSITRSTMPSAEATHITGR